MNFEKYTKLNNELFNESFEKNYSVIDKIFYYFSFLGNFASIVFAYFFVNGLLLASSDDFAGKSVVVPMITIISLTAFELLKRFLFKRATLNILTFKKMKPEVIYTSILTVLLVVSSFYLSLSGSKEFSDKNEKLVTKHEVNNKIVVDSLNNYYENKINKLEKDKTVYVNMVTEGTQNVKLRSEYNTLISNTNNDIKALGQERDAKIAEYNKKTEDRLGDQKDKVSSNVTAFLLISTFIELIILIGVWFDTYYEFRSFKEYDEKLDTDAKMMKFKTYMMLLSVMYNNGKVKKGEVLDSFSRFKDVCKIRGVNVNDKTIRDFHIICKHLKINTISGKIRTADKHFEEAKELLEEYYS